MRPALRQTATKSEKQNKTNNREYNIMLMDNILHNLRTQQKIQEQK